MSDMSIREACATFGLAAPPLDRRALKKRFLELAKKHHPDRPNGSAAKMTKLNAAYSVLKKLQVPKPCDTGGANSTSSGMGPDAVSGAPDFNIPGVNLSTREMWLPWQREATRRKASIGPEACGSLFQFVKHERYMERRAREELEKAAAAASSSSSSSGYTAEHFLREQHKRINASDGAGGGGRSVGLVALTKRYVVAKIKAMPRMIMSRVRYIVTGLG
jgi:curved DNA-binding protein CbpA